MSVGSVSERKFTPDDLLRMPEGERFELVDGELVERNKSVYSSYVAGRAYGKLSNHCHQTSQCWVFPE